MCNINMYYKGYVFKQSFTHRSEYLKTFGDWLLVLVTHSLV